MLLYDKVFASDADTVNMILVRENIVVLSASWRSSYCVVIWVLETSLVFLG